MAEPYDEERLQRLEHLAERNAESIAGLLDVVVGPQLPGGSRDLERGLVHSTRRLQLTRLQATGGWLAVAGLIANVATKLIGGG